jgi:hypothetical protein
MSDCRIARTLLCTIALAGIPLGCAAADNLPAARAHRDDAARAVPPAAFFPSSALLELQRDNVKQLTAIRQETRGRVLAGEANRTDLAQVEARLAAARSSLYAAQAQYAADRASYLAIIGVSPAELGHKRAPARATRR